MHGQAYISKAEPFVKAISNVMIEALFLYGEPIVICDETCYSREARNALKSDKWDTYFYEVPTVPEECKKRAIATGQSYLIPVIDEMWSRRDPLGPDENTYYDIIIESPATKLLKVFDPHSGIHSSSCQLGVGCNCASHLGNNRDY